MDRDSTVRNAMYEAIGAAGEAAMPLVLQALSDSDETVRYRGVFAASKIFEKADADSELSKSVLEATHSPILSFTKYFAD